MAQSLSGLESFDPSGSTPQPAPLSGLALPSLFGGMGADGGLSGAAGAGATGGAQGGPGLDFFQLLGSLQGAGDSGISATPPNLSSLLGQIGQGGIGSGSLGQMDGNGSFAGFGMGGGMSQPTAPPSATGIIGSTGGQLDSIALIRQALGLGQNVANGFNTGVAGSSAASSGGGGLSLNDFGGTSLSNSEGAGTASPFQQGDLVSSFLNDPTLGQWATGGGLISGSMIPQDIWDQFKSDPAFMQALRTGGESNFSNLLSDNPLGGTGGLEMPNLSADGSGFGVQDVSSGIGGVNSILGLVQGIKNGTFAQNPMGLLQNLYGIYNAANNVGGFGGPSIGTGLGNLASVLGTGIGGGELGGAGSVLAGGAEGLSSIPGAAAGAGAGLTGGAIFGGISAIPSVWELLNDTGFFGLFPKDRMQETRGIKKNFDTAWPAYEGTPDTLNAINTTNDPAELQKLLQTANYQLAQGPAVSQYISTHGGYKQGVAPAQDLSRISPLSPMYSMDAVLGNTQALDKLAALGITPDMGPQGLNISDVWSNPQAMLGGLWGAAGMDPGQNINNLWNTGGPAQDIYNEDTQMYEKQPTRWSLTPEQNAMFAQPGQRLQGIQQLFSGLNPQFASTPLGLTLAHLLGA